MPDTLLEVKDLKTHFFTRRGVVKAVDGVSFSLRAGETLGIVGESGSGKSITALSLVRLVPQPAARIVGGQVLLEGEDLLRKSETEMRHIRGAKIAMVLQDPLTSLNPVLSIGSQVTEAITLHQGLRGRSLWERAVDILRKLKIPSPEQRMASFPHQMSGGMRQRVVGAIAISCQPRVLIADEPTTSLDVTVQAQYLRLLKEIQAESGLAILFITHDFGVVAKMCDRVAVMYAGRIVEMAGVRDLFTMPAHPYTEALMRSVPKLEEQVDRLYSIEGQPPAPDRLPPGCPFAPRCPYVMDRCRQEYPPQVTIGAGHTASCWRRS